MKPLRFHPRWFLLALAACGGNLEKDRICIGHPCLDTFQSQACATYVRCYERTGGTRGSLDSSYGPMGTCWGLNSVAAQSCTAACTSAIGSLRAAYPDAGC